MPLGLLWLELLSNLSHPDTPPWLAILVIPFGTVSLVLGWVMHAMLLVGASLVRGAGPDRDLPVEAGDS
jgi:threonine/homoserine/homoserine lactone efflux protein